MGLLEGLIHWSDNNVYKQHISGILEKKPRFEFMPQSG
jgi:hypothetical protein